MSEIQRVLRSKAEARRSYDRLSRIYTWLGEMWERKPRQRALEALAVQPGERVLEIGCGTGRDLLALLHAAGAAGQVVGLDLSPGMLAVSRENWRKASLQAPGLVCADGASLPLADGSFDVVYSSFTLELFDTPEIGAFLAECQRVLVPGGRLGIVSLSKSGGSKNLIKYYEYFHRRYPGIVDCRPIFAAQALESAGFRVEWSKNLSMWGLRVEVALAFV